MSTITIPFEQWCKLCDALYCTPDAPVELVVGKAETLRANLSEAQKSLYDCCPSNEDAPTPGGHNCCARPYAPDGEIFDDGSECQCACHKMAFHAGVKNEGT